MRKRNKYLFLCNQQVWNMIINVENTGNKKISRVCYITMKKNQINRRLFIEINNNNNKKKKYIYIYIFPWRVLLGIFPLCF